MYIDTQMSSPAHKAEVQRTASSAGCGVSPKTSFSLYCRRHPKKQECRERSPLPGCGVSPKIPFYLSCRHRRLISKTHKSILSKSTGLTRHNYLHKKPSKLAVRNTKSKAILTTV